MEEKLLLKDIKTARAHRVGPNKRNKNQKIVVILASLNVNYESFLEARK